MAVLGLENGAGAAMLGIVIYLYTYLLPSLIAFLRGHPRFRLLLVFNIFVAPMQMALVYIILPHLSEGLTRLQLIALSFAETLGPSWLGLLVWVLLPMSSPDLRMLAARNTKAFDLFAAIPLILWFCYGIVLLQPSLAIEAHAIIAGEATLFVWAQFLSLVGTALFNLVTVYFLVVRDSPVARSHGILPRACGFAGTFLGVGILHLPVASSSLPLQILSALLVGLGSLGSSLVLWRLGRSFSIMPEARKLVTTGPYAFARHPLYALEIVIILGATLQFKQPWAALLGLGAILLLFARSHYEERVLAGAFPEYKNYRRRVKRFGVV